MKNFSLIEVNATIYPPYRGPLEILVEYDVFLKSHNNEFRLIYASATWELNWWLYNGVYMHIHFPQNTVLLSNQSEGFTGWRNGSWANPDNPILECKTSGSWLLKNNVNITFELKQEKSGDSSVVILDFPSSGILLSLMFFPLFITGIRVKRHSQKLK
jgi:hypothetical protein